MLSQEIIMFDSKLMSSSELSTQISSKNSCAFGSLSWDWECESEKTKQKYLSLKCWENN